MSKDSQMEKEDFSELEWVNLQKQIRVAGQIAHEETIQGKFMRKAKESPLVPLGCLSTAIILSVGLYSLSKGKKELSQKLMRFRVLAQGMTIGALMLSLITASFKK